MKYTALIPTLMVGLLAFSSTGLAQSTDSPQTQALQNDVQRYSLDVGGEPLTDLLDTILDKRFPEARLLIHETVKARAVPIAFDGATIDTIIIALARMNNLRICQYANDVIEVIDAAIYQVPCASNGEPVEVVEVGFDKDAEVPEWLRIKDPKDTSGYFISSMWKLDDQPPTAANNHIEHTPDVNLNQAEPSEQADVSANAASQVPTDYKRQMIQTVDALNAGNFCERADADRRGIKDRNGRVAFRLQKGMLKQNIEDLLREFELPNVLVYQIGQHNVFNDICMEADSINLLVQQIVEPYVTPALVYVGIFKNNVMAVFYANDPTFAKYLVRHGTVQRSIDPVSKFTEGDWQ